MASPGNKGGSSKRAQQDGQILKELVRTLRSDLNMLSNEAKKKYPAVKEVGCLMTSSVLYAIKSLLPRYACIPCAWRS